MRLTTNDEPEVGELTLPPVLAALADPVRLSIVTQLAAADQDLSCGAIDLSVKTSTATHHVATLRRAGILHQYYAGTSRMNALRWSDIETAFPGLLRAVLTSATQGA